MSWFRNLKLRPKFLVAFGIIMFVAVVQASLSYQALQEANAADVRTAEANDLVTTTWEARTVVRRLREPLPRLPDHRRPRHPRRHRERPRRVRRGHRRAPLARRRRSPARAADGPHRRGRQHLGDPGRGSRHRVPSGQRRGRDPARGAHPAHRRAVRRSPSTATRCAACSRPRSTRPRPSSPTPGPPVDAAGNRLRLSLLGGTLLLCFFCILLAMYLSAIIAEPLERVTKRARLVGEGDFDIDKTGIDRRDEVGEVAASFDATIDTLRTVSGQADAISGGRLSAPVLDDPIPGTLGDSFTGMVAYLREIRTVAADLSRGDLAGDVSVRSEEDELGRSLQAMTQNLRATVDDVRSVAEYVGHRHDGAGRGFRGVRPPGHRGRRRGQRHHRGHRAAGDGDRAGVELGGLDRRRGAGGHARGRRGRRGEHRRHRPRQQRARQRRPGRDVDGQHRRDPRPHQRLGRAARGALPPGQRHRRAHPGDRRPDQPPGPQRRDRGGPGR